MGLATWNRILSVPIVICAMTACGMKFQTGDASSSTASPSEPTSPASSAPAGSPQVPHLLDSYGSNRPAWQVAGVDYYVGVPSGLTLKDPATISMSGVSVNSSTRVVTVSADNTILDGYDFSLNGGWSVTITKSNVTISNSNFLVGPTQTATPIFGSLASGSITVLNSTIDGGANSNVGGLILFAGKGTLTVKYTWLKNAGCDMIDMNVNSGGPSSLVAEYNLFENGGQPGQHGDFIQFLSGPSSPVTATILYNTTMEANGLSSQGFMIEPDVGSSIGVIAGGEIGYNTMIGYNNAFTGITVADLTGTFTVDHNYFDPTGTSGGLAFGGARGGPNDGNSYSVYVHNVNMVSGAIVQDPGLP